MSELINELKSLNDKNYDLFVRVLEKIEKEENGMKEVIKNGQK